MTDPSFDPPDPSLRAGIEPDERVISDPGAPVIIGVSFDRQVLAQQYLLAMGGLKQSGALDLQDAVVVTKTNDGSVKVVETIDPTPGRSALNGAMWTSLLGLVLGGPVGWIAGLGIGGRQQSLRALVAEALHGAQLAGHHAGTHLGRIDAAAGLVELFLGASQHVAELAEFRLDGPQHFPHLRTAFFQRQRAKAHLQAAQRGQQRGRPGQRDPVFANSVVCGGDTYLSRIVRASARRRSSIALPAASAPGASARSCASSKRS